ncbi:MAG: SusC/RagA family TonB-linked outer membrane protein [Chitinophagaceae bacterium]|nr:SusC/RagA family TonB-linked outer membrane protein [Bacteroidota bacterium]MCC6256781.1 SusC/RagA family TonB-linked outer membrane protein [Chitinophagaceae bacterium]MCW5917041.1 SusC/RagA family TonB-linked outer membrane protein [Ferruginibacter sp.]
MRKTTQKIYQLLTVMLVLLLGGLQASAQNQVSGTVTDSKSGLGIPNVTVSIKGANISTQTGADGSFRLNAPANAKSVVVSSVGYATQEVSLKGISSVVIRLVQTDQKLEEVVVVAYGTRRKTDLTGSMVSVGTKDFQKGSIASSEQLLQGKVAGLEVTTGGGSAGGGSKLRIRGGASLNASNDPLVVVDGVPVDGNDISGSGNYLNTINPEDIESISVLKDASATALYGSRASNGVLIITTKKGRNGKPVFNFNTQLSVAKVYDYIDVLTADQVRKIVSDQADITGSDKYLNKLGHASTDWQDRIYQNALTSNNNLSVSGSLRHKNFNLPYRVSLGYLYQEGVLLTNKFERNSYAVNLSPKFFDDHLAVNVNFKYAHNKTRFADQGAVGSAVSMDPTQYPINNDPKTGGYFEWMQDGAPFALAPRNPLGLLNLRDNLSRVDRVVGNVQLDYKLHFFPDLHIQANLGLDNAFGRGNDVVDSTSASAFAPTGSGRRSYYQQRKRNYIADLSLFYNKNFGNGNRLDVLALHSYQDFYTLVYNYPSFRTNGNEIPNSMAPFATDKPEYRLESYLGRINLTLIDQFLLTGSIRRDASSKFSKENRVGYFPAGAIAWKLNETFFKNSSLVSDLKARFSYGETGQQDGIGYYTYLPVYSYSASSAEYQFGNSFYQYLRPSAYDEHVRWESTATTNIGLDFGFAKNRISGSIDVYRKKTKDLLSVVPIAPGANFNIELLTNVGNMENKGAEFVLNLVPIRKRNLNWDLGFNISYNESKITKLLVNPDPNFKGIDVSGISGGTGNSIGKFTVGYAPYSFFVYKQVYDKTTGRPIEGLYEDINRDGQVNSDDRYLYKKPAPDFMFGFNTTLTIKKFSFGVAGHGMIDNYLYNNYNSGSGALTSLQDPLGTVKNASVDYLKTGFTNNQYFSDYYIENASFFRLDNINIGYNFGKLIHPKTNFRMTANVQNVFVITKYSGADPESASVSGVDNNIYPRPRIFSLGASLDF